MTFVAEIVLLPIALNAMSQQCICLPWSAFSYAGSPVIECHVVSYRNHETGSIAVRSGGAVAELREWHHSFSASETLSASQARCLYPTLSIFLPTLVSYARQHSVSRTVTKPPSTTTTLITLAFLLL